MLVFFTNQLKNIFYFYNNSSSCEQQETEVAYETERNDHEMENIEVDEPIIQKVRAVGSYVKQEMADDVSDPLYTEDYLDASPKRKSPNKKQSTIHNGEQVFGSDILYFNVVINRFQLHRRQHHHHHHHHTTQRLYSNVSLD